ncbi:FAD:protein FMN transferase [Priestia koreensis]|uniref:FAD:protein FMN transferase n=1 Tax=Priestia koreensis TaxID=284581 RepID=A0A0M0KPQ9_9BACI|nr:FAD:protein FMN transferase [Priestia koreensis]KOO40373.1 hypothetical protein AMD01_21155 [Priestia koreensis]
MSKLQAYTKSMLCMGTIISIKVIASPNSEKNVHNDLEKVSTIFRQVESIASRFSPDSEVMSLLEKNGKPARVSPFLFEMTRFALQIAEATDGVYDPTIGNQMEKSGFNRHYLTNRIQQTALSTSPTTYKDVILYPELGAIQLQKPLILDFGSIAKGFAVDVAVKALSFYEGVMIDAGGDVFVRGRNERRELWKVGIKHPIEKDRPLAVLNVTDVAICTSGSYERKSAHDTSFHHIQFPKGSSPNELISCTVVAPFGMMADSLSTASFLLGYKKAKKLLQELQVEGLFITPSLHIYKTDRMEAYVDEYKL